MPNTRMWVLLGLLAVSTLSTGTPPDRDVLADEQPATVELPGIPPPGNDLCTNAWVGTLLIADTTFATIEDPLPEVCSPGPGPPPAITSPGVWYRVIGNGQQLYATTCGDDLPGISIVTDFDTRLTVYCQDCEDLRCVTGNEDGNVSGQDVCFANPGASTVTWCSREDVEYWILVHGADEVGTLSINMDTLGPCTEPPAECFREGACCNCADPPLDCSSEYPDDCAATSGNFQGEDSVCLVPAPATVFENNPNAFIPGPPGASDEIFVEDDLPIADLDVGIVATHSWVGDLVFTLTHEDTGTAVSLVDTPGGGAYGCPGDDYDIVLDDEGSGGPVDFLCDLPVNDTSPPNYLPDDPLAAFDGESSFGTWSLSFRDVAPSFDDGTLDTWSLRVRTDAGLYPFCECDDEGDDENDDEGHDGARQWPRHERS